MLLYMDTGHKHCYNKKQRHRPDFRQIFRLVLHLCCLHFRIALDIKEAFPNECPQCMLHGGNDNKNQYFFVKKRKSPFFLEFFVNP